MEPEIRGTLHICPLTQKYDMFPDTLKIIKWVTFMLVYKWSYSIKDNVYSMEWILKLEYLCQISRHYPNFRMVFWKATWWLYGIPQLDFFILQTCMNSLWKVQCWSDMEVWKNMKKTGLLYSRSLTPQEKFIHWGLICRDQKLYSAHRFILFPPEV